MLKINSTACIEASQEKTWAVLSDIENIPLWSEPVISATCTTKAKRGVGAVRTCELKNNITITERWVSWQEGHSFTYEGYNLPMVKSAKNTWSLRSENGKTLLTTQAEVVLKGGVFGRLLEPLMGLVTHKMGADALAAFKYLVEQGEPFAGKHSSLPRVPVTC